MFVGEQCPGVVAQVAAICTTGPSNHDPVPPRRPLSLLRAPRGVEDRGVRRVRRRGRRPSSRSPGSDESTSC